jgi:hypothetical protein
MRFDLKSVLIAVGTTALVLSIAPRPSVKNQFENQAKAINNIHAIVHFLERERVCEHALSQGDIAELESRFPPVELIDPWGNKYLFTALPEYQHGKDSKILHVYSCGLDGVSNSNGNDPDDINSWSHDRQPSYYALQYQKDVRRARFLQLLILSVVVTLISLFAMSKIRSKRVGVRNVTS